MKKFLVVAVLLLIQSVAAALPPVTITTDHGSLGCRAEAWRKNNDVYADPPPREDVKYQPPVNNQFFLDSPGTIQAHAAKNFGSGNWTALGEAFLTATWTPLLTSPPPSGPVNSPFLKLQYDHVSQCVIPGTTGKTAGSSGASCGSLIRNFRSNSPAAVEVSCDMIFAASLVDLTNRPGLQMGMMRAEFGDNYAEVTYNFIEDVWVLKSKLRRFSNSIGTPQEKTETISDGPELYYSCKCYYTVNPQQQINTKVVVSKLDDPHGTNLGFNDNLLTNLIGPGGSGMDNSCSSFGTGYVKIVPAVTYNP